MQFLSDIKVEFQKFFAKVQNFVENLELLWRFGRRWMFIILIGLASWYTVVDFLTTRIHYHARIADVQNTPTGRFIKVRIPVNPEDPPAKHKFTLETFKNESNWTDMSFNPQFVETIANTAMENKLDVTIQVSRGISWFFINPGDPNLNNIFVADDGDHLVQRVIVQRFGWRRFTIPDNYLRSGGNTSYPWVITYGIMALAWAFSILLSFLLLYKVPGWIRWALTKIWYLLVNHNWRDVYQKQVINRLPLKAKKMLGY